MNKITPRVDFAFKKLFGSFENKGLLMSLINAIVSEGDQVADLELKNPYTLTVYQTGKMSVLDIKAKSVAGRRFNVEMPLSEGDSFDKRSIYYDDALHDVFELHDIELHKFRKDVPQLTAALDRWSAFLMRAHQLDQRHLPPQLANDPHIS